MAFQYVLVKNSGRGRGYLPTIMPEASKIFTNDLLFDTMCGLIQAPNNDYSPTYDLTSPLYSLNADQALAVNGKWIVANDPSLHDIK